MNLTQYITHIICFLVLLIGIIMVSSPYFKNSEVKKEKNKDAYISLTTLGSLIMILSIMYGLAIMYKN